jgi:hypothetical protein
VSLIPGSLQGTITENYGNKKGVVMPGASQHGYIRDYFVFYVRG